MSRVHANSAPEEFSLATSTSEQQYDDAALKGVAAHLKLLLKIIQEHKDACYKEKNDRRRMLRVAAMMTILDTVRTRIQKCQSFGNKRSTAELQQCNTEPREKRHSSEVVVDEKEKLRKELSASLAAQRSLEIMCSSLGKEKEIMAAELSRRVQELSGMEELINDLKAQNEMLLQKVQECASKHKDRECVGGGEIQGNAALQEQNKILSEQVLRSLDGYRLMKWKLKEAQLENMMMWRATDEMRAKVMTSLERVRNYEEQLSSSSGSNPPVDVQEEIVALENMFESFQMLVAKHDQRQGDCANLKRENNSCKAVVLAREEEVT